MSQSRVTTAQVQQRQLSSRQTTSARATTTNAAKAKQDRIPDSRKVRDQDYTNQCAERVFNFFTDKGYDGLLPSIKDLQTGIILKTFIDMISFLINLLDVQIAPPTDFKDPNQIMTFLNTIQTQLSYPETNQIKQTELKSISSAITWRKFMLLLSWLTELTDYTLSVDVDYQEPQVTELFIKNLCQAPDSEQILQSKEYFEFISQFYKDFLEMGGDETKLKLNLQTQFGMWKDEAKVNEQKMQQEVKKLDVEIRRFRLKLEEEINRAKQELNAVMETASSCQLDLNLCDDASYVGNSVMEVSTQQLLELRQRNQQRLEDANKKLSERVTQQEVNMMPQLQEKLNFINGQMRQNQIKQQELQADQDALQATIEALPESFAEYKRTDFLHQQKQGELKNMEQHLQELNKSLEEKQTRKSKIQKQIQQLCQNLQINQNISIDEITKLQSEMRRKLYAAEQAVQVTEKELRDLENEKVIMVQNLNQLNEQLENQKKRVEIMKQDHEKDAASLKQMNDTYYKNTQNLNEQIGQMKKQKVQVSAQIEESKQLLNQQKALLEKEQKRTEAEMKKMIAIIAAIYEKLIESRQKSRNSLEMARDKVGEAMQMFK
ncbi:HEC/Ndc80p_domain-containing protein [Hexamita inflata]|uniref:Kinetochore protein NDC80 n=1 Tax=Hexamita inflata TaxID=28002 RepID=A0AA86V3Q9_9EUKA|nr:HEC/Ndc80p domain-containing protein [Hexamita inflata]CAI9975057.1 HEC/Ndc80p domain-containing protein [Hexamita inflata]